MSQPYPVLDHDDLLDRLGLGSDGKPKSKKSHWIMTPVSAKEHLIPRVGVILPHKVNCPKTRNARLAEICKACDHRVKINVVKMRTICYYPLISGQVSMRE